MILITLNVHTNQSGIVILYKSKYVSVWVYVSLDSGRVAQFGQMILD